MTTRSSKSANLSMPRGVPAVPTTDSRSFDKIMSEVEDWCSCSTPRSKSPVSEDQDSPATVHFTGLVQGREPATDTDNETNDKHPHNANRRKISDGRSAQRPGNIIAQENCRSAVKPRAPTRSPTLSSPNGNSLRTVPEVFTAPRTLGAMTSGASGPQPMQIAQATVQHPVAQTTDRGVQLNDMHETAAPRISETTAGTNIRVGEFLQHIPLADSRIHDSIAVLQQAALPASAAHPPRTRRSARNRRPEISIEDTEEQRRTRSPTPTIIVNLDAYRGYGYLCWDWQRQVNPKLQSTDGQNHVFVTPVVWPEGADGKRWLRPGPEPVAPIGQPPDTYEPALKLWYPGRKCQEPDDDGDGGLLRCFYRNRLAF